MATAPKQQETPQQALTKPGKLIKLLDKHGIDHAAAERLAQQMKPCKEVVEKAHLTHKRVPEAVSEAPDAPLLSCNRRHALFCAADHAYNRHLALRLRPDDVWLTIAQGVAEHINAPGNAEAFRSKFVAHEGKKQLTVVQGPEPNYPRFVEDVVMLAEQNMVDTTLSSALRCDFTTTTPSSAIASRIVIMKALESYFSYGLTLMCGIPAVIMEGSLEDWERVESKVRQVESLDLGLDWWFKDLKPVLAKLTDTYKGQVDETWWGSILTRQSMGSGPSYWSGWLCAFVPYDSSQKRRERVTALLDQDKVPSGTQTVAFKLIDLAGREHKMELLTGFLGCTVDAAEGSVAPCIGWAVAEDAAEAEAQLAEAKVSEAVAAISAWAAAHVPGATLSPELAQQPGAEEGWRVAQVRRLTAAVKELQRLAEERTRRAARNGAMAARADNNVVDAAMAAAHACDSQGPSGPKEPEAEKFTVLLRELLDEIRRARSLLRGGAGASAAVHAGAGTGQQPRTGPLAAARRLLRWVRGG